MPGQIIILTAEPFKLLAIWVHCSLYFCTYKIKIPATSCLYVEHLGQGVKSTTVYLPGGQSWYDLRNGAAYRGGVSHKLEVTQESIPAFQKAGTIVPRKDRFRRSSTQMVNDPYTLVCSSLSEILLFTCFR